MKVSSNCIALVKSFEGWYGKAYKCPAGVWTIGYGHTGTVDGKAIHSRMIISSEKATQLLEDDLNKAANDVKRLVTVRLNQNQFDALTSFVFNCGAGNLSRSTLLKKVNKKEFSAAADQFLAWVRGGGKVLPGLERRRKEERALFLKPMKKKVSAYNQTKFIKQLQKICGLKVTGRPNNALLDALPKISPITNSTHKVIKPLKKILKSKGYKISSTKAKWDNKLSTAVVQYKKASKINNTTKQCGKKFWKTIIKL